ncbi:sugar phosphate isomerase/epimerase [Rhodobacterales bacterium]|nr:sugar phosphate isomerase/epimerase [Rhodobacterales bacterium]
MLYHRLRLRRFGGEGDILTSRPLGLAHLSAIDLAPHDLIDLAASAGYSSVALRLHSAAPGTPVYPLSPGTGEAHALKEHGRRRGVRVSEVELVPITEDLRIADLQPLLEVADELGARGLIVTGDIADEALLVERFRSLCQDAANHGLLVHLEFMRWRDVGTLPAAQQVVERSGQDNARILIDLLHLVRSGSTVKDLAAVPGELISLVQICDARAELEGDIIAEARGGRLMPYAGALPIDALLSSLGPDVDWAVELPGMGEGDLRRGALEKAARLLRTPG